ncbi:protease HtpX [Planomonospora sphaerica]|uniref:Protease HtpX n=1 Tax=Planomonospora sphaerica TaxID=161355 RepID=A0A171D8Z5_9ACTN|nr:M48 family metalloprotease [Planomonospora sphaerica]GAT67821.1 protease HtpX [Planomonospora sphaerica]
MMTTVPPIALAGLAALSDTLRTAARLPGVLVYLSPELGTNACAERRCAPAPMVGIGSALLDVRTAALQGAVAHEIAHHALGHTSDPTVPVLDRLSRWTAIAAVLAWPARLPLALVLTLAASAAALWLVSTWCQRRAEYAADAHAALLLDAVGLPGRWVVASMLIADLPGEPRWYGLGGWLIGSHPATRARIRRITTVSRSGGAR